MSERVFVLDSTLRDGAQGEGIAFTVNDKLNIARELDALGVSYIEAGNPGSNPKDMAFFESVGSLGLKSAKIVAFGATRRRGVTVSQDDNVQALLKAGTQAVSIFGKSWDFHVTDVLRASLPENLEMIEETLAFFASRGREVIFDAEHFFDGFAANPDYALQTLKAAARCGAKTLCLCDTNGGAMPGDIARITSQVARAFPELIVGIHCHDDCGMAVANTVTAVENGARHVQGTLLGFGERCGNANLSAVMAVLQEKRGYACIPESCMRDLCRASRAVAGVANIIIDNRAPFVGASAFAHKGGMHIDGVSKAPRSFEHIDPSRVGNERRFLLSEVSGRTLVLQKIRALMPQLQKDSPQTQQIMDRLKAQELKGYQYENAEASFELLVMKELGLFKPHFSLSYFKTMGERITSLSALPATTSTAIIKIKVGDSEEVAAEEGKGPVNALDRALRKALLKFYPQLSKVVLTDYRVRVMEAKDATASKTRVLIESTDGARVWTTVGISTDIIGASWKALADGMEYKLMMDESK